MKKVGQRWCQKGTQDMINLKTIYLYEMWNTVTGLLRQIPESPLECENFYAPYNKVVYGCQFSTFVLVIMLYKE